MISASALSAISGTAAAPPPRGRKGQVAYRPLVGSGKPGAVPREAPATLPGGSAQPDAATPRGTLLNLAV